MRRIILICVLLAGLSLMSASAKIPPLEPRTVTYTTYGFVESVGVWTTECAPNILNPDKEDCNWTCVDGCQVGTLVGTKTEDALHGWIIFALIGFGLLAIVLLTSLKKNHRPPPYAPDEEWRFTDDDQPQASPKT